MHFSGQGLLLLVLASGVLVSAGTEQAMSFHVLEFAGAQVKYQCVIASL